MNSNAFWNGLLDENSSLLDVIDNKKQPSEIASITMTSSTTNLMDLKPLRRRRRSNQNNRTGHSMFSIVSSTEDQPTFVKNETKTVSKIVPAQTPNSANTNVDNTNSTGAQATIKKELDGGERMESGGNVEIQIKDEPIDEIITSNVDEQNMQSIRQQIVPVVKTETGNNISVVSSATMQRPITIQQSTQLQQQTHPQTFSSNDQTLILSSRPIRRLTTNGPTDGKAGTVFIRNISSDHS